MAVAGGVHGRNLPRALRSFLVRTDRAIVSGKMRAVRVAYSLKAFVGLSAEVGLKRD